VLTCSEVSSICDIAAEMPLSLVSFRESVFCLKTYLNQYDAEFLPIFKSANSVCYETVREAEMNTAIHIPNSFTDEMLVRN
jgi:hypothetical protein